MLLQTSNFLNYIVFFFNIAISQMFNFLINEAFDLFLHFISILIKERFLNDGEGQSYVER